MISAPLGLPLALVPDQSSLVDWQIGSAYTILFALEERHMGKRYPAMATIRYVGRFVPRKVPAGRVLAHNRVTHAIDTPPGERGFKAWTWPEGEVPPHFKPCACGWSGLPHVALKPR